MTGYILKIIAIVTMLIDHIGVICIAPSSNFKLYLAMRIIGRISFPIFCFCLVEGYKHTKSLSKYIGRLAIFALVSEIPFDLAFYYDQAGNNNMYFGSQNVFFTLLIGIVCIRLIDWAYMESVANVKDSSSKTIRYGDKFIYFVLICFVTLIGGVAAEKLNCDYGMRGIILIVVLFVFRNNKIIQVVMGSITIIVTDVVNVLEKYVGFSHIHLNSLRTSISYSVSKIDNVLDATKKYYECSADQAKMLVWIQMYAIIGLVIALLYNGNRGTKLKYTFYVFYPVHLIILYFIGRYLI